MALQSVDTGHRRVVSSTGGKPKVQRFGKLLGWDGAELGFWRFLGVGEKTKAQ